MKIKSNIPSEELSLLIAEHICKWPKDQLERNIPDIATNLHASMALLTNVSSIVIYYDDMVAHMGVQRAKYWQVHIKRKGKAGEDCAYKNLGCGIDKYFERAICLAVLAANGFEIEQIWE